MIDELHVLRDLTNSIQIPPFVTIRTSFNSNPKIGMDSGPKSPNNKFVESGRKS